MSASRAFEYVVLLIFWIEAASVACAATAPHLSHCVFHPVVDHFLWRAIRSDAGDDAAQPTREELR